MSGLVPVGWLLLAVAAPGADAGVSSDTGRDAPGTASSDVAAEIPAGLAPARDGGAALLPMGTAQSPFPPAAPMSPAPQAEARVTPAARLRGRVVAKGTRRPLVGASITIDAEAAGETDAEGRFDLGVPAGRRQVQVQIPGYEPLHTVVHVVGGAGAGEGASPVLWRLSPRQSVERYQIVVVRPDDRAARTSLRDEELVRVPGSLGDPFRAIESLPGVAQPLWPLAIYAIRGGNPGNTGFFVDGVRLPAVFHFAVGSSVIHPYFLEQVDYYPGGYPLRLGRYVSGVVSARTATPAMDRLHASADVRLFDAGAFAAAPWAGGQGTVAAAGRFSYTGLIASAVIDRVSFGYWDYQVRVDRRVGPGRLTLFAFGSRDVFEQLPPENRARMPGGGGQQVVGEAGPAEGDLDLSFHRADLRWAGSLAGGKLDAGLLAGRDASATSIRAIVGHEGLPVSVRTLTLAPRLSFSRSLAPSLEGEVGLDGEAQSFRPRSNFIRASEQDLFRDRAVLSGALYAGLEWKFRDRLSLAPGFRLDAFAEEGTERLEPGPRLNLRVRPAGEVWLKASAGRYVQLASMPLAVPGFEGFGLEKYGVQWSWQGSTGVEAPLAEALSLDATLFYQRLRLTDLASVFTYDIQQQDVLEVRDGQSYGIDVLVRRPSARRLHGWVAYTLSRSERVFGYYRVRAASDWDQRHIFNLVAAYRLGRGYTVGSRFRLATGRPYPVFDERNYRIEYQRLPAFYQVDVRADKRFVFDKYLLDVYVEVVNATLTRQEFDLRRRLDGTLDRGSYRIALPSIGVHGEF